MILDEEESFHQCKMVIAKVITGCYLYAANPMFLLQLLILVSTC
jgi:hypothetical protein